MTGIATHCRDNPATGRTGCGGPYRGNQAHCVARAAWSTHADGICHETFSTPNASEAHWVRGVHTDPRRVPALHYDETRQHWTRPMSEKSRAALRAKS